MANNSQKTYQLGQSLWYDNIQRKLLKNGELAEMIANGVIYGVTSNPSIFNNAIAKTDDYDADLVPLAQAGKSADEIFETLAVEDIRAAADLFAPLYQATEGGDGYVSLEVNPDLAHDTEVTCSEALRLWALVNRPNLMIKVPATKAGIPAIQRLIAAGLNINVTLIFSQERYVEVMEAYIAGLEERATAGKDLAQIASVASFFISRIDSKIDGWLDALVEAGGPHAEQAAGLRGQAAIANAKLAYQRFMQVFGDGRFAALKAKGARVQRPLWASTSTKNPTYSDVLYIDELIGPGTVNTVPPKTLLAFNDHGQPLPLLTTNVDAAEAALAGLAAVGVSLAQATQELEDEGVASFSQAFADLLVAVEARRTQATE